MALIPTRYTQSGVSSWKTLIGRPLSAAHTHLVTDDAEFLVLVDNWFLGSDALSIYRRLNHPGQPIVVNGPNHGVLIRDPAF